MFTNVRCWADNFCLADVIILKKYNLEKIANVLVLVNDDSDTVDEMDDRLRHPVAGGSFAAEYGYSRHNLLALLRSHCLDGEISVNNPEDVELLALVLSRFEFVYLISQSR